MSKSGELTKPPITTKRFLVKMRAVLYIETWATVTEFTKEAAEKQALESLCKDITDGAVYLGPFNSKKEASRQMKQYFKEIELLI
jgi:hypothetical protein